MPDAQVSTVIKKCGFWGWCAVDFSYCVSLSLLSALLIILNPVITINYTINYTDHCTRGYNVEQVGTRKIAMSLKIKNIMNNVAHYETAKNTNL